MRHVAAAAAAVALWILPAPLCAQTTAAAADPREVNLAAYVELLRSDVRTQKIAFLTEMMELTEAQDAAFWPIYREYDAALAGLADQRLAMLRDYAANHGALTEAKAEALAQTAFDIDRRRTELLQTYVGRVRAATSPTVALRFLQVEHQLLLILDLQLSALLPIVK